ncbi:threonine aldolase family protein [Microvirga pudoricolor]|uniref:threonine aldolase family protein n=1 Tax=Microvirga pudoricolor TaxID=2778729 RepID=UPI00194E0C27|nr:beta-eliminating lyase-related protein [Microvirga pudoricolor]MBM6594921.1 low specificity L-threonine aldolase [Microvirga pudoricolor]
MNFGSDNIVGASAPVLEAIARHNGGAMAAYGNDDLTKSVKASFANIFERDVQVFFVTTGTAANALALASAVPPWGLCVCHREAHVIDDECGAPEFFMHGAKLSGLPVVGSKLEARDVAAYLKGLPKAVKQMPPKALSISQATESGTVYGLAELSALGEVCRTGGLSLHMDGARFANALVSLGCTPAEMTWKSGVDILSFGATKNGCLMAEAIVVFNTALADALDYRCKRAGQIISKGRLIASQFEGYLAGDHWLANARHANALAKRLSHGLARLPGVRIAWPTEANEVFPIIPAAMDRALREAGAHYMSWTDLSLDRQESVADDESLIRLVVSFATEETQVDRLLEIASAAVSRQAAE